MKTRKQTGLYAAWTIFTPILNIEDMSWTNQDWYFHVVWAVRAWLPTRLTRIQWSGYKVLNFSCWTCSAYSPCPAPPPRVDTIKDSKCLCCVLLLFSSLYWSPTPYFPAGNVKELSHCINVTGTFSRTVCICTKTKESIVLVVGLVFYLFIFLWIKVCWRSKCCRVVVGKVS